jgi:hypothetical protein
MKNWLIPIVFFMLTFPLIVSGKNLYGPGFYLKKDGYHSSRELFTALFSKGFDSVNAFFYWCCDCIYYYGMVWGLSYQEMNIVLFVILQPLLILLFFILWIIEKRRVRRLMNSLTK